jgi:lipid-A-disaccharide synthase
LFTVRTRLLANPPDCFVGIDFNFFNLLLEGMLKRHGVKTVHYVSPTIWAWRSWRIKSIKRNVDLMLTLYPFETGIYEEHGMRVKFVGHPKAQEISPDEGKSLMSGVRQRLGLGVEDEVVAILPGSRRSEVAYSGPDFFLAAVLIKEKRPGVKFLVPAANSRRKQQIEKMLIEFGLDILVIDGQARQVMTAADVVLVNSGTATLEAMLLRKPMVMSYRLGKLTYAFVIRLVKTPYFALPNILAQRELIPELIQGDARPDALARAVDKMFDPGVQQALMEEFDGIHRLLNLNSGSVAADAVIDLCRAQTGDRNVPE